VVFLVVVLSIGRIDAPSLKDSDALNCLVRELMMQTYKIEKLVKDRSIRIALKRALADDGALSDDEVIEILAAAYDGNGLRKQEFEDLQAIMKNAITVSASSRMLIDAFSKAFYIPPIKPAPSASQLTKNFKLSEFGCNDGTPVPAEYLENVKNLAQNLQLIRDRVGASISINSGYRTPAYNKKIGGVSNSQHKLAKAADIVVKGWRPSQVHALINSMIEDKTLKQGGLGRYNTFTHYDIRGERARWG